MATKGQDIPTSRFNSRNFDSYRHDKCKDPTGRGSRETEDDRRGAPYMITYGVGGVLSILTAKQIATKIVEYKAMPGDQKAMDSLEINLEDVPEGKTKIYKMGPKPIFVKHRTLAEIEKERAVNTADLRHPERDEDRVKKPEWSILVGVCTHLACIPIPGSGEYGGYFCPCHGSHYDASGRTAKAQRRGIWKCPNMNSSARTWSVWANHKHKK